MKATRPVQYLFFIAFLAMCSGTALARATGETVIRTGTIKEDLYLVGARVAVSADVEGDIIAAGGTVDVDRRVAGDVMAAGGTVDIRADVSDDLRVAGGSVTIDGEIGDEVVAAGGRVNLGRKARIGGRAWLSGGEVTVSGRVTGKLNAIAGNVVIAGELLDDTDLVAGEIEILPGAKIKGNLTYRSDHEATIAPGAEIDGVITRRPPAPSERPTRAQRTGADILLIVSLIVTGTGLFLIFPNFSVLAARTIAHEPWRCLGLGLAVLATVPFVAVILLATVIGIPLALLLTALYLSLLLGGFLTGVFYLGDWGFHRLRRDAALTRGWRIISVIAALIVVGLIRLIPVAGGFIMLVVLLLGLGALTLQAFRTYSASARPVAGARPRTKPKQTA